MKTTNKGIYILGFLGLILGLSLDFLWRQQVYEVYPYTLALLFSLLYGLAYNNKHSLRLILSSFLTAVFMALPVLPISPSADSLATEQILSMLIFYPTFCYMVHSFHYAYHHGDSLKLNYSNLYAGVWNSIPLLLIASIFLCVAHLLIMLTAYIFKTANINFLYQLYFDNEHFRIIFNAVMYFIGLGIAQQSIKIVYSLTYLLGRMMYYLYPFVAFISILYFFLYWLNYYSAGTDYIDPLLILSPLIILGIIFFNGYFQDGKHLAEYSKGMTRVLKFYRVILFFLTSMMSYHIFNQMALPLNGLLFLSILVLYCVAYAITAFMNKEHELVMIPRFNIAIALFFIVSFFSFNNPAKPVNLLIGKEGIRLGSVTKNIYSFPKAGGLTPGAQQMVQIQKNQQRIDQLLNQTGLSWQDQPSEQTYQFKSGSEVFSICRSMSKNGYVFGVYQNNQCQINVDGQLHPVKQYQLLASKQDILTWTKAASELKLAVELKPQARRTGMDSTFHDSDLNALTACMVEVNGQHYIGKTVYKSCSVVIGDRESSYSNFQSLNLKAEALANYLLDSIDQQLKEQGYQWEKPTEKQGIVAGYSGNEGIHICRVLYEGSYQVGENINEQCVITYAGKAYSFDDYQRLSQTESKVAHWKAGQAYMSLAHLYLPTGFEFSKDGSVNYLYTCRTIYDNQIHVGKLIAGRCNIGVDGNEVIEQSMQVLAK